MTAPLCFTHEPERRAICAVATICPSGPRVGSTSGQQPFWPPKTRIGRRSVLVACNALWRNSISGVLCDRSDS